MVKHPLVEKVTMCEIDGKVIEVRAAAVGRYGFLPTSHHGGAAASNCGTGLQEAPAHPFFGL